MSAPDWLASLQAAETGADAIAAITAGIDPEAEAPSPEALAAWWPECPEAARTEADARLAQLAESVAAARTEADGEPPDWLPAARFWARDGSPVLAWLPRLLRRQLPIPGTYRLEWVLAGLAASDLSAVWLEVRDTARDTCPPHPLAPIVRAWIERPPEVARHRAAAVRYPSALTQAREGFGTGHLLPPLTGGPVAGGQLSLLPGLGPDYDEYGGEFLASVLPVALYTTRGKGAPLDIRIGLEALFDGVGRGRRGGGGRLPPIPWGHLLGRIYPGVKVSRVAGSRWPGLRRALDLLAKDDRWLLPVANGRGGWEGWRVVAPNPVPLTGKPSERVGFVVTLPDTVDPRHGSIHDRRVIAAAGARSSPALALASGLPVVWDRPGDTRREVGRRGWEWVEAPSAYPLMTLRGVASLMYPQGWPRRKRWPEIEAEARGLLEWLASIRYIRIAPEPGGFRIAPGRDWPGWKAAQRPLIETPG